MAVKKYKYSTQKDEYCSPHTKVKEMASKNGNKIYSDYVLVDETLMAMIEKLFAKLQCSKYLISSGYRTSEHDKAVGGNGAGQHTKGKAVDACFYDKTGKIISAKIVCCVAQDIGFKGIANISRNYKYVHLDMRDNGIYKGDETKGNYTVTNDFYKYFNVEKEDVARYTGEKDKRKKVEYFSVYKGTSQSIITALQSIGEKTTFVYRREIAKKNNIKSYIGSSSQNTKMLTLLKEGKLIKSI